MNKKLSRLGIVRVALLIAITVGFFHFSNSNSPLPTNIEQAVHLANMARADDYDIGELAVEGHVILGSETKEKVTTVYAISTYGRLEFENGIFTTASGTFGNPSVIIFSKSDQGEYILQEYKELMDGNEYWTFPAKYLDALSHNDSYQELVRQQETQAKDYLKHIGRAATINIGHVETKHPIIENVQASNHLLEIRSHTEMINFPSWLGTTERIEHGVRFIYETSQSRTDDGHSLITYTKKKTNGNIVAVYRYKIIGSDVFLQ